MKGRFGPKVSFPIGPGESEYAPAESFDENKIVAAILAVGWFVRNDLEGAAMNREQFVSEYRKMLAIVEKT